MDEGDGVEGADVRDHIRYSTVLHFRTGPNEPRLSVPAQNFSWGISGPYTSSTRGNPLHGQKLHPTDASDPAPSKWTVEDVCAWLEKEKLSSPAVQAWAVREEISGVALMGMTEKLLRTSLPTSTLGWRIRLLRTLEPLALRDQYLISCEEQSWQDLNISVQPSLPCDALVGTYRRGAPFSTIFDVSITIYHVDGNRWGAVAGANNANAPKRGEPVLQYDLDGVSLGGYQMSGSNGPMEQMYSSFQLRFTSILIHTSVTREIHRQGRAPTLALLKLKEDEVEDTEGKPIPFGISTYLSQHLHEKMWQQRWGLIAGWNPRMHRYFPASFRAAVRAMLLCRLRPESPFHKLPKDAMVVLFRVMARGEKATPFVPYPFPRCTLQESQEQ